MRVVLVGEESAGIGVLRGLQRMDVDIVAVMARGDRGQTAGASMDAVARLAGHDIWPAELVREPTLADRMREARVDLVLNVHSLFIVDAAPLDATTFGWYNLHPGPLPSYAGLNAPSWAIYRGESSHAVTIHRMVGRVDAGPIAYTARFPITDTDTGLTLSARCVRHGVPLMLKLVAAFARDPRSVPATDIDQDELRAHRRDDVPGWGVIAWDRSATEVARMVRAFDYRPLRSPWGEPVGILAGHEVGIVSVRLTGIPATARAGSVIQSEDGGLLVACADDWLSIERVRDGGEVVKAKLLLEPRNDKVGAPT